MIISECILCFTLTVKSFTACASGMNPSSASNVTVQSPTIGSIDVMENLSNALSGPLYLILSVCPSYCTLCNPPLLNFVLSCTEHSSDEPMIH